MDAQPLQTIENAKEYMLASFRQFESIVGDTAQCKRFFAIALNVVEQVPKVLQCSRSSFRNALVEAARLDLEPNSVQQLCWIIPRGREARLEMGYRGLVQLVMRDGGVKKVWANLVYAEDLWNYDGGKDKITHVPMETFEDPGLENMKGAYACAVLNSGETQNARMSRKELEAARKMSRSSAYDGPFASEMYKKTPLRRLCKLLPLRSPDVARAAWLEDEKQGVVPDPVEEKPKVYTVHGVDIVTGEEKTEIVEVPMPSEAHIDASAETREEVNARILRTWERLKDLSALPQLKHPPSHYAGGDCDDAAALEFANYLTRLMLEAEREQRT